MKMKKEYGIIGVLSLLLVFGGTMYLTQSQLPNTYVCSVNHNIGVFYKLSSTHKTGYYLNENNITKRKVCSKGIWISISEYAKLNNIPVEKLLQPKTPQSNYTKTSVEYRCNPNKCVRIK